MVQVPAVSQGIYPIGQYKDGAGTIWRSVIDETKSDYNPDSHIPISQYFSEGNGGEAR